MSGFQYGYSAPAGSSAAPAQSTALSSFTNTASSAPGTSTGFSFGSSASPFGSSASATSTSTTDFSFGRSSFGAPTRSNLKSTSSKFSFSLNASSAPASSAPASSAFGASNPSSAAAPSFGFGSGPATTTSAAYAPPFSLNSSAAPSTAPSAPSTTVATTAPVTPPTNSAASSGTTGSIQDFCFGSSFRTSASSEAQPSTTLPTFGAPTSAPATVSTTNTSTAATQTSTSHVVASTSGTTSNVCSTVSTQPEILLEIPEKTVQEDTSVRIKKGFDSSSPVKSVEYGGTPPQPAEQYCPTSEAEIFLLLKSLEDLIAVAMAPTSSKTSTTTEAMTNETKSIIQSFLDKEYSILADENQRIKLRTGLQDLIKDKFFPPDVGPIFQGMLDQLEDGVSAFQQARTKFSNDQALASQIKSTSDALLSKISACDAKKTKYRELEVEKLRIQAEQAQVLAEIEAMVEETRPLEDRLREFIQQRAVSSEKNTGCQALIDIEEELWGNFKNMLQKYFV